MPYGEAALRLSPRDPSRASLLAALGFARFATRDYAGAVEAAEAAMQEAPDTAAAYVVAAISYVGAQRLEEAQRAFVCLEKLAPSLAEARMSGQWLATNEDYRRRAHGFFRIAAGLEDAASVPELD